MKIDHILLTTDLSEEALRPCEPVGEFARSLGAKLTLLYVVEELRVAPHGAPLAPPVSPPDTERRLAEAKEELEKQKAALGDGLDVHVDAIASERVAKAVADYATSHDVDLIALSTHGRTGFRHLALGSVAEAILRNSPVPVLSFPRAK